VILYGDCREVLPELAAGCVDCVVTSPPYLRQRRYGDSSDEIGLEETLADYVTTIADVFDQIRRVLRPGGWVWLNIGDKANNSGGAGGDWALGNGKSAAMANGGPGRFRDPAFAEAMLPAFVLRLGALPSGKVLGQWLAGVSEIVAIDPAARWIDPARTNTEVLVVPAESTVRALVEHLDDTERDAAWGEAWRDADARARAAIDAHLDGLDALGDPRVARDVTAAVPTGGTLMVASSMPVRDVETFAAARDDVRFVANRGTNGIDGFTSTAVGFALGSASPTVALVGDLCFLHDANGLLGASERGIDLTIVVVDNRGGAIFSFLPQADLPEHFETLFGTPQSVDVGALASLHGITVLEVVAPDAVGMAVRAGTDAGGLQVVVVRTDRRANVAGHRAAFAAVSAALSARSGD